MGQPILFFYHLPKTGGTTLNRIIEANFSSNEIASVYTREEMERFETMGPEKLSSLKAIQGHILITDWKRLFRLPCPLTVFTMLRHPVERIISEFFFLRSWPHHHLHEFLVREKISLVEYVISMRKELVFRGKDYLTRLLAGRHFQPGEPCPAPILLEAKHRLSREFTFFGLVERFDESLLLLKKITGLKEICYERQNINITRPAREEIDRKTLNTIREYNRADLELFSYAEKLFDRRIRALGDSFPKELHDFQFVNTKYQKIASLLLSNCSAQAGDIRNPK